MRRTTLAAACAALSGLAALPQAAAMPVTRTVNEHASHHRQHHAAPLPRAVLRRLARQARLLHLSHPERSPYSLFLQLAGRWRAAHARPRADAVLPSIGAAARRYRLSAAGMVRVARCESGLDRKATNGQFLGLFQLGDFARSRYLHGAWTDAYANAIAAARYARASGGWGPWTCGFAYD